MLCTGSAWGHLIHEGLSLLHLALFVGKNLRSRNDKNNNLKLRRSLLTLGMSNNFRAMSKNAPGKDVVAHRYTPKYNHLANSRWGVARVKTKVGLWRAALLPTWTVEYCSAVLHPCTFCCFFSSSSFLFFIYALLGELTATYSIIQLVTSACNEDPYSTENYAPHRLGWIVNHLIGSVTSGDSGIMFRRAIVCQSPEPHPNTDQGIRYFLSSRLIRE